MKRYDTKTSFVRTTCPVCKGPSLDTITQKDMLDSMYTLASCRSCSHRFIAPVPSAAQLKAYYNGPYQVPPYQQKKVIRKATMVLDLLGKQGIPKRAKILDIGASHGFFLHEAQKRGYTPYGIELSKDAVKTAKRRFGLIVENMPIERSSYAKRRAFFDAVVMLDVLEHIRSPQNTIRLISSIVKRGGWVVFTVPNGASTELRWFGKFWEWMSPPAHIHYFTRESLSALLEHHGFKVVYARTGQGDSAGNILFHAYLAFRQWLFYGLRWFYGSKRLLAMKKNITTHLDQSHYDKGKEFTGIEGIIYSICRTCDPLLSRFDAERYTHMQGPTLIIIGRKR